MNAPTEPGSFEFKGKIRHPRLYADYYYDRWTPCSVFESKWESGGEELCGETWPHQRVAVVAPLSAFEGEWRHVKQTKTEASIPAPSGIEALVCADIAERQIVGMQTYGVSVQDNPLSPLEWLDHLYKEMLDGSIYAKRLMPEIQKMCEQNEKLRKMLEECAGTFQQYADLHSAKGTLASIEKAMNNQQMADKCRHLLKP